MKTNRKFEYQNEEKEQANLRLILFVVIFLALLNGLFAQSIVKRNNLGQFEHVTTSPRDSVTYSAIKETFIDSKGIKYTVYQTKNGKYFLLRTSKKTGKKYREYLRLLN